MGELARIPTKLQSIAQFSPTGQKTTEKPHKYFALDIHMTPGKLYDDWD